MRRLAAPVLLDIGSIRNLRPRFPSGRLARSVSVLAGGTALAQLIALAAAPILTRLYAPDCFGTVGVFTSLASVVAVAATMRYQLAIPLPAKDEAGAALVALSLMIIPASTASAGLALWFFRTPIATWSNAPALAAYLWLLPLSVALIAMYQVFTYWAVRKRAFSQMARAKLHQSTCGVTAQLAFFFLGPLGLLLGQFVGSAAGAGTLAMLAFRDDRDAFRATNWPAMARMAVRYQRFPQISTLSGLANAGGLALPTLLIASLFGPFVAGQFALVQRVLDYPSTLLGGAVAHVYFSESAFALRDSPSALYALYVRVTKRLAALAIVPMLILLATGPWLFPLAFGAHWEEAGRFVQVLAPMVAIRLVASPLSQTLNVLERQTWQLGWDVFRLALVLASFASAAYLDFSPMQTVAGYASVMIVSYLVLWLLQLVILVWAKQS